MWYVSQLLDQAYAAERAGSLPQPDHPRHLLLDRLEVAGLTSGSLPDFVWAYRKWKALADTLSRCGAPHRITRKALAWRSP